MFACGLRGSRELSAKTSRKKPSKPAPTTTSESWTTKSRLPRETTTQAKEPARPGACLLADCEGRESFQRRPAGKNHQSPRPPRPRSLGRPNHDRLERPPPKQRNRRGRARVCLRIARVARAFSEDQQEKTIKARAHHDLGVLDDQITIASRDHHPSKGTGEAGGVFACGLRGSRELSAKTSRKKPSKPAPTTTSESWTTRSRSPRETTTQAKEPARPGACLLADCEGRESFQRRPAGKNHQSPRPPRPRSLGRPDHDRLERPPPKQRNRRGRARVCLRIARVARAFSEDQQEKTIKARAHHDLGVLDDQITLSEPKILTLPVLARASPRPGPPATPAVPRRSARSPGRAGVRGRRQRSDRAGAGSRSPRACVCACRR